ncbi:hypothetical protein EON65_07475 [archaeon]|nr:MAG: hypothetical protein EON65_07475 [archaeon]
MALFNPLDTFGDRYGSVNVLLGRLSTGKLCFTFSSPDPTPSSSYDHIQVSIVLEIILLFKLSSLDIKAKVHDLSVYLEFDDSLRESEIPHVDNSAKPITDTPNIYQIMLTRFLNYLCLLKIDILSMKMNINGLATLQVSNVEGSMHFQDMTEQHTLSLGELSLVYSTPQLTSPSRTDSTFLSVDNLQYIREKASTKLLYGSVCLNVAIHEKPELLCMIQRLLSLAILFSQYSPTFYSSRLRQHQAELYDRLGQCNKQQASGSIEYDEEEGLFYYDLNASVSSSDSITFPDSEMTEAPNLNLAGKQLCVLCSYSDTEGLYETFEVHNVSLDVQSNTSTLMIGCVKTNHRSDTSGGVSYVGENVFVLTASKQGNDKQLLKAQLNPLQLRISTKALSNFFTLHSILSPFLVCLDKFAAMLSIQEQLDVDLPAHTVGARNTHQFSYCFQAAQLSLALYDNSNQSDVSLSVQTASLVPSEGKAAGHSLRVETFRVDCQAQPVLTVANIFAMHEQASEHSVKESVKIESVDLHVTLACVSSISKILSGIRPRTLGGVADSKYTSVWKAIHIDVTSHVSRIVIVQKTQVRCTYLSGQDFRNKHTGDTLYELCVPEAVELEQKVLGNWVEDTKIVLHDKISLSCSKVDSFTSEVLKTKMLLQITAKKNLETHREGEGGCQPGVYRKPCVTIRIVNAWGECFHTRRLAIGYHLSTLGLDVGNCSLLCDVQDLQPMLRIINEYNLLSYEHPVYTEPRRYCHPRVDTILQSPSSIFKLQINKVHVTLEHLYKPVVFLTLQEACLYNTSFSDYIFQHSMSLCNMVLSELSADYAIHKTVLSSVDGGGNQQNTVSAHYTLVNEYTAHASDFMYSGGVYEIVIESLRFIYLQRATLTLVCYIRDYLIKDIYDTLYQEFPSSQGVDTTARYKGIFRLGIRVANSEVHLPNSSCAMEALVIFFKSLDVYRLNDVYSQSNSLVKYCQGPLISQDIFLSDYANCDIFFHRMVTYAEMLFEKPVYFHSLQQIVLNDAYYWEINNANVIENIVESQIGWNVLKYANDLARKADPKLPVYLTNQSYLMIELHDAMIASYCNNNPICEHQEISCKYHIYQVTPYDASQHTNGQIHNFIDNENDKDNLRNTMIVYVEAKEVDWVLSQGQYWAIVNLIQQNFCELQEHVEDPWVLPEPKCVDINEDLYGKFVLSKYLPIINSVPIVISKGEFSFYLLEFLLIYIC